MPERLSVSFTRIRQRVHTINFNPVETSPGVWEYESVTIEPGRWNYDGVVDSIISDRYPSDRMWAVTNNYLSTLGMAGTKEAQEHEREFAEMQLWRETAKAIAREFFPVEG